MNHIRIIVVLSLLLPVTGCMSMAQQGGISRAYTAIREGKYEFALRKLSSAEKYVAPTPEIRAEIAFLRGWSYEGLKKLPEAVGSYRYLVETFPKSIYAFQARERLKVLDAPAAPTAPTGKE